jgi:hypothetical protein
MPPLTILFTSRCAQEFDSNEAFVESIRRGEAEDHALASAQLGQALGQSQVGECLENVGISRLRKFLEERIELSYRRNVAKILPLLQQDLQQAEARLAETDAEISALSVERLRNGANAFRERFSRELTNVIHGTAKASPDMCGESLEAEQVKGGSFLEQTQMRSEQWKSILDVEVGNSRHKLFGGAQYHRAVREFTVAVRHMPAPPVTEDEIANAAGMGDMHDGVNFMRAACVLAMEKAQNTFEPMLEAMKVRSVYIMERLFDIVAGIVTQKGKNDLSIDTVAQSAGFQDLVHVIFDNFVKEQIRICLKKCRDDLHGMTRFVTWDVDGRGGSSGLYKSLPTPQKMVEIYSVALENSRISGESSKKSSGSRRPMPSRAGGDASDWGAEGVEMDSRRAAKGSSRRRWPISWSGTTRHNRRARQIDMSAVVEEWQEASSNPHASSSVENNSPRESYGEITVRDEEHGSNHDVLVSPLDAIAIL